MTTIAYDGRYVVADGRSTIGNLVTGKKARKIWVIDLMVNGLQEKAIFAGAGSYQSINMVRSHLEREDFLMAEVVPELEPGSFSGMVVLQDGRCYILEDRLVPMEQEYPAALGSGTDYAMAAMALGKTAIEAVKVACDLDVYSGGELMVVDIDSLSFTEGEVAA